MSDINWPEGWLPGTTDNFVSNEIVVPNLTSQAVWAALINTSLWPSYYNNASDIRFYNGPGPELFAAARFRFTTFGFLVESEVVEFVPPAPNKAARIAWRGWVEGNESERLDVIHAWLFEDLPGNRVRILTQETQNGKPARDMAVATPNPMLNAHQAWLNGLAGAALKIKL